MELLRTLKFIVSHPLNRKNKIKSFFRFVRWQVATRIWKEAIAVKFINNSRLLVTRGMHGATGNIYTGLHEFEDMAFVLHLLREGDGFVDVGANVGSYTILAGSVVGARCISIEPIPDTFHHLVDNINLNGISATVSALNIGVGEKNGVIRFTSGFDAVNHVATDSEQSTAETIQVPVKRLDDVIKSFKPLLIKIDVEGFETVVIKGADKVLSNKSLLAVIMELNGSGGRYDFDEEKLHKAMLDYGFNAFTYAPFKRELVRLQGRSETSGNTLYIRNVEQVISRLESAPKFKTSNGWEI